jgi:putative intracellular protease/amidase
MSTDLPQREAPAQRAGAPRRVAILLFDDVEVLDFAGPFEVFGVARSVGGDAAFDVVTVALDPGEVTARNGLRVVPSGTAASLSGVDILVIPGGAGTRREMRNPAMLDFVHEASGAAEIVLSVCTGALLLGRRRAPARAHGDDALGGDGGARGSGQRCAAASRIARHRQWRACRLCRRQRRDRRRASRGRAAARQAAGARDGAGDGI